MPIAEITIVCTTDGSEPGADGLERWSGDLLPIGRRRFAPGVQPAVGQSLTLRLPSGRSPIAA